MVKAFVVLSPSFKSQDPNKLACELQDHVKKITAPYKYPRKASKHMCINKKTPTLILAMGRLETERLDSVQTQ